MKTASTAFAALGHAKRLSIFKLLIDAGETGKMAGDIGRALDIPGSTLNFHLKELLLADLITAEPRGRCVCYRAEYHKAQALIEFFSKDVAVKNA